MARFRSVIERERQENFFTLCATGTAQELQEAIDAGADVTYTGTYDSTPLMAVANKNTPEAVKVLLDAKANVTPQDSNGVSALLWAAMNNAGADTRTRDNEGKSALDYAQENYKLKGTNIIGGLMRN